MKFIKNTTGITFIRILKLTSLCLNFFLGLCFSAGVPVITSSGYGCPSARYKVTGTIRTSDSIHSPLKDVRVTLRNPSPDSDKEGAFFAHSTFTYTSGKYYLFIPCENRPWILHAEPTKDISRNGLGEFNSDSSIYKAKDTIITIQIDSTYDSTSGKWKHNEETTIDLYLDPK
jgi:hypothetical protein